MRRNHPEQDIQIALNDFCVRRKIPMYHFANEGRRTPYACHMLKRQGFKAGVADCFFPRGNGQSAGMWLELKTATGRPTAAQMTFLEAMRQEGYTALWCRGIDEAIQIVSEYYLL